MRRSVAHLTGLAFVVLAPVAGAAPAGPEEQPLRIEYTAHDGCPDALGFFWHVRARTRRVRLAEAEELAKVVSVRIEKDSTASVGTLEIPGPAPEPFVRRVRAESCEEVVLALSLVLALAYDPDAVLVFPPVPPAPAPVLPPPPPPAAPMIAPPPPEPERHPWRAAFGVDGLFMSGVVADALQPGLAVFLDFGRARGLFSPTLGAAFVAVPKETASSSPDPTAQFGYYGVRVSLCPLALDFTERLVLSPCLGADLGGISATSSRPEPLDTAPPPVLWGAGLLLARLRYNFWDRLFAETIAGGGVSFMRAPFSVYGTRSDVRIPVFAPPLGVFDLGVGLGAYFP